MSINLQNIVNQAILPKLDQYLGEQGYVRGEFSPTRNLFDVLRDRRYNVERNEAMRLASQSDAKTVGQMLHSVFNNVTGQQSTPSTATKTISSDLAKILPILSSIVDPNTFNQLHGSAGSQTLLAKQLYDASRGLEDPSGNIGWSPEYANQVAEAVMRSGGTKATLGLQPGEIFANGVNNGLIRTYGNPSEVANSIVRASKPLTAAKDVNLPEADRYATVRSLMSLGLSPEESANRLYRQSNLSSMPPVDPVFGKLNPLLTRNAALSPLARQYAATMYLNDSVGFTPNSPAANMVQAINQGNPNQLDTQSWLDVMQRSGINPNLARQLLLNYETLQPSMVKYNIGELVRQRQSVSDVLPQIASQIGENGHLAATSLFNLPNDVPAMDRVSQLRKALLAHVPDEQAASTLALRTMLATSNVANRMGYNNPEEFYKAFNTQNLNRQQSLQNFSTQTANNQTAMANLNRTPFVSRVVDSVSAPQFGKPQIANVFGAMPKYGVPNTVSSIFPK